MDNLSKSISSFSFDCYKELNKNEPQGNIFFSPSSISLAMGMVDLGAKGNTAAQIEKTMYFGRPGDNTKSLPSSQEGCKVEGVHREFKQLLTDLNAHSKIYELSLANRLYGQKGFEFVTQYLICTEELYNAKLETVDFQNDTETARQTINSWVAGQTNDKIKELLAKNSIDTSTVLALVNAVYFKGKWKKPFKIEDTKDEIFNVNKNEKKTVKMMSQTGNFMLGHLPDIKSKILALPYEGDLSMFILLPDEVDGLTQVEGKITAEILENATKIENMREAKVNLKLPSFMIETTFDLIPVLKNLGMTDLFSINVNLSGISSQTLKVSTIVHKSYVEVNEEGTEAAAATGVGVVAVSAPLLIDFHVNHSFMLVIKHNQSNTLLFHGKYTSP
ncbi:serpin B3-like [Spea bombifrons]|uniref:serpin B3-like n=1 Tax=Spea bombifrons TaxID=233779 RepID=UPI00234A3C06|nr:serpin B3-like [Spea bombifrons]